MSINYKVKDIQGNISDVEIETDKTVKDFKQEIEDVLQNENYRRDLINIIYQQKILQDDQKIESIGAEENTCFSISTVPTVKIGFNVPKSHDYSNLNLQLKDFLINKDCKDQDKIINAICYQTPNLSPEKICLYSSNWEALHGAISVTDGQRFGLYIQEENLTPLFFKNSSKCILFAFESNKQLKDYKTDIESEFTGEFTYNGSKLDFNKKAEDYPKFAEIVNGQEKKGFCLLL